MWQASAGKAEREMPIPDDLRDVAITYECPACQKPIVKKGSWFKTIGNFRCSSCQSTLRIGYLDKVALFQRHRPSA
jgi:ribosomal protein L37AE/L43A